MDNTETQTYLLIRLLASLQVDFPAPVAMDHTPKPRRTIASTRKSTGRHSANGSGVEGEENGLVMHWKEGLLLSTWSTWRAFKLFSKSPDRIHYLNVSSELHLQNKRHPPELEFEFIYVISSISKWI